MLITLTYFAEFVMLLGIGIAVYSVTAKQVVFGRRGRRPIWGYVVLLAIALQFVPALSDPANLLSPNDYAKNLILHWGTVVVAGLGSAFLSVLGVCLLSKEEI